MKRILVAFAMSMVLSTQAFAQVVLWQEGKHYEVIADTASKKPIVREFFSFWCPGCYRYEPLVAQFKKNLPENAKFEKTHVNFMGFNSRETQEQATKAMLIARALKEELKFNTALFNYIHKQRGNITNLEDLKRLYVLNGGEEAKFDKMASSFMVNSLIKRHDKTLNDFRPHVNSVPTFIVNDKFKVKFTNDMTVDDMIALVNWLTTQK